MSTSQQRSCEVMRARVCFDAELGSQFSKSQSHDTTCGLTGILRFYLKGVFRSRNGCYFSLLPQEENQNLLQQQPSLWCGDSLKRNVLIHLSPGPFADLSSSPSGVNCSHSCSLQDKGIFFHLPVSPERLATLMIVCVCV